MKKALAFDYVNWRKIESSRNVVPYRIYWGKTEYHRTEQWLMTAYDLDKKVMRTFAMVDMRNLRGSDVGIPDAFTVNTEK